MRQLQSISLIIGTILFFITGCTRVNEETVITTNFSSVDTNDATNNFYDNEQSHLLPQKSISVEGETSQTFEIDLSTLPIHSVIVKETLLGEDGNNFIGSYRYDGPSLFDILDKCPLKKNNAEEFPPIVDAYVEVSNDAGEKVVFSWGEIFYPIHLNEIIIATSVMQIVPSKSKEYWPLPESSRIISAADLLTERNISNPNRITIKSLTKDYEINRDISPLFSKEIKVYNNESELFTIFEMPAEIGNITYPNIFYGRGRGIHAVTPFTGYFLKEILIPSFPLNKQSIRCGMFSIAAIDGYRAAFSYSEIMNRNDQSEVLLVDEGDSRGGRYRAYPAADFFSDRSIKSIVEIMYQQIR